MMKKVRYDKTKCSVIGCTNQHVVLHRPPASEPRRSSWVNFIYAGNVPTNVPKTLFVCANHFKEECFTNLRKFTEGYSERLYLVEGAVPSVYVDHIYPTIVASYRLPSFATKGCQTEKTKMCTVGTQLSITTLQSRFRSKGTQTTPHCTDDSTSTVDVEHEHAVVTSTLKRPGIDDTCERKTPILKAKRHCLDQTIAEDNPLEGSSTMDSPSDQQDYKYDPDLITVKIEMPDETLQPYPSA